MSIINKDLQVDLVLEVLKKIGEVVTKANRSINKSEALEIGAIIKSFLHANMDFFNYENLLDLDKNHNLFSSGQVGLSKVRGYYNLGVVEDPDLWFSLVAFDPGRQTSIHDHATWGVNCGVSGQNKIELFKRLDDGDDENFKIEHTEEWIIGCGDTAYWLDPPCNIHQQTTIGDKVAYQLVLMGHDPRGTIQNQYDLENGIIKKVPYGPK